MNTIEILMKDGCTRKESEKAVERGTTIFEASEFKTNFDLYMIDFAADEEERNKFVDMVENDNAPEDWGIVVFEEKKYYIMRVN